MDFSELKRFLDSLPEMGIPGVDMTVYQAHRSIFRHSAGFRDREAEAPVRRDETYFAYSCTKPLTVVCALQLFEKGAFLMQLESVNDGMHAHFYHKCGFYDANNLIPRAMLL